MRVRLGSLLGFRRSEGGAAAPKHQKRSCDQHQQGSGRHQHPEFAEALANPGDKTQLETKSLLELDA